MLKACLGGERLLCLAEKGCWQIKNTRGRSTQKGKQFFAPPRAEKGSTVNPEYRIQPKADQHFPRFCHIPDTCGLSTPFARRRKIGQQPFRGGSQTTYLWLLIIYLALPGPTPITPMPAHSGCAWLLPTLPCYLLHLLVLCHHPHTCSLVLTAHRFPFYFSLVCLPVALQVSILAATDVAEGGAPHS